MIRFPHMDVIEHTNFDKPENYKGPHPERNLRQRLYPANGADLPGMNVLVNREHLFYPRCGYAYPRRIISSLSRPVILAPLLSYNRTLFVRQHPAETGR